MRCLNCHKKTKLKYNQDYCSKKCQQAAYQKRWYASFRNGGFQWLNQKWMPTLLEDKVWIKTGFESLRAYLIRRQWATYNEIAWEIGISYNFAKDLYRRYNIKRNYVYLKE